MILAKAWKETSLFNLVSVSLQTWISLVHVDML